MNFSDLTDFTDCQLMVLFSHGNGRAFDEIFHRHCKNLFRYLQRMTNNHSEAEDVLQETFVRVAKGASSYTPENTFKSWLYRIATNRCLSHIKKRSHLRLVPVPLDTLHSSESGPFTVVSDTEVLDAFKAAVFALPPNVRAAVVLTELEGNTNQQTADILDIPLGTVKTHLSRGRAILRKKLACWVREDTVNE